MHTTSDTPAGYSSWHAMDARRLVVVEKVAFHASNKAEQVDPGCISAANIWPSTKCQPVDLRVVTAGARAAPAKATSRDRVRAT